MNALTVDYSPDFLISVQFSSLPSLSHFTTRSRLWQVQWEASTHFGLVVAARCIEHLLDQWFDWQRRMFFDVCHNWRRYSGDHAHGTQLFSVQMRHCCGVQASTDSARVGPLLWLSLEEPVLFFRSITFRRSQFSSDFWLLIDRSGMDTH